MGYQTLESIYYKNNAVYETTYEARFNSEATTKLPFTIRTKYGNTYQLFLVNVPEITTLIERIGQTVKERPFLTGEEQPEAFADDYRMKLMLEEIQATNEIEGVRTEKSELTKALDEPDNKNMRFHSIVQKYRKLMKRENTTLTTVEDVRRVYDELLEREIETESLPDGTIFRKGTVSVYRRSGKSEPIHAGLYPERAITDGMTTLLLYLNADMMSYVKIAIAHYYFGYIHPFYDGNGRLARFISSSLLFSAKDEFLALKISSVFKEQRQQYDAMFELTNGERNKGDMTPFVLMFLRVLDQAALEINEEMRKYESQLVNIEAFLSAKQLQNKNEEAILFLIYQADILHNNINIKELATHMNKSDETTRKYVYKLEREGYITRGGPGDRGSFYVSDMLGREVEQFGMTNA